MGVEGDDFPVPGKLLPSSQEMTSWFPGNDVLVSGRSIPIDGVWYEGSDFLVPGI